MQVVSFKVPPGVEEELHELSDFLGYRSRSSFIRICVQKELARLHYNKELPKNYKVPLVKRFFFE